MMDSSSRKFKAATAMRAISGSPDFMDFIELLEAHHAELQVEIENHSDPIDVWRTQGALRTIRDLITEITPLQQ